MSRDLCREAMRQWFVAVDEAQRRCLPYSWHNCYAVLDQPR